MTEFRGAGTGYSTWPVAVMAGHELTLEASPLDAGTYVQIYISNGTGRGLDSPFIGNSLGTAQSIRTDVPARAERVLLLALNRRAANNWRQVFHCQISASPGRG